VRLLLDENLSRRLVPFLQAAFPGSSQVVLEGLERANDWEVWQYASEQGFVVVTKDSDFHELSVLHGQPPQVIWLQIGNASKARIMQVLLNNATAIAERLRDSETTCLVIN
jgi:predicted nuclease of predicted toxin-antitoxin system